MIKKILKYMAYEHGKFTNIYRKICKIDSFENARLLKRRNFFYSIGEGCRVNIGICVTDPKYVRIGNNTTLSACTLIGHDGSVVIYRNLTGKILDKVGKIDIGSNCFIGHGATIMPNVVIGNNVIVAAGSVVTRNVEKGDIVAGVPAKVIGKTDDYIKKLEKETEGYPWYELIKNRKEAFDSKVEAKLLPMRLEYFYGESE